ncbi:MAG: glutamate racemase [Thermochromatium sp.]
MASLAHRSAPTPNQPIGVFDSGLGGLTVLREIRRLLPSEDLLYVADSAHVPYGDKSTAFIASRAIAITEFLLERGAKAIVVACNTATSAAAKLLRTRYSIPLIAMEPAVKPAIERTRSGVVAVLATRQTLASHNFSALLGRLDTDAEILLQPCPGLVERIEAGDWTGEGTRTLLRQYLEPLLARGADTLVLGCTHYPLLTPLIRELVGPEVLILDSGLGVARQVHRRLTEAELLAPTERTGREHFWTSAHPARIHALMARLWASEVELAHWVESEDDPGSPGSLALESI